MANKPKIRFNGHQDDWEEKKLKDIISYGASAIRACDATTDGQYDLYDANGVIGKINTYANNKEYISIIKDGSGVGRVRLLPPYTNCLGTMGIISPEVENDVRFVFCQIERKNFRHHIISGAIPHIYFKDYGEDNVNIPSLPEQQQIGEFFAALDELIGAKEQELEKLRQMKQALLEKMFPCEDDNNLYGGGNSQIINLLQDYNLTISTAPNTPQIRFRGFTEPWEKKLIKDVCKVNTGDKNTQDKVHNGKYPFYVRSQKVERINSYSYEGEAILTAGDGDIGKIFHYATGKIGVHQRVYMLTDIKCNSLYLYHFFAKNLHRRVKSMSAKNTVDSIRMEMITEMALMIPKNETEQILIGNFFRAQDNAINAAKEQIQKLIILKQALLDKMFAA